ncbi:MAG: stimulus-sensing domain-containing protein [Alphaproteobacteria bacterium]|nr:stimulus-sensing domain-containing protein [Alphaproteobacteria bacterium]
MKRSTELDTGTGKNNRWFRVGTQRGEIDQLIDLYWGGPERRITGLTVRIIGVNVLALFSLLLGIVYLGQYQTGLISAKLEIFENEIYLVTAALSEGAVQGHLSDEERATDPLLKDEAKNMVGRLGATLGSRILIFDANGVLVADSEVSQSEKEISPLFRVVKDNEKLQSVEILKDMAGFIVSLLPEHDTLPLYRGILSKYARDYPDALEALKRRVSISVWRDSQDEIILTGAMSMVDNGQIVGVVMLVSEGKDINEALGDAWFDIVMIFLVTLLITILLSIYLSGVIAQPLRKLASAAENVRKGKMKYTEIPDMSDRHDEIGELSLVLRDMTQALWDRMDTIEAFASDVSHEIKNPLTSLKSAIETASVVKKKADLDKLLGIIQHDVERLDRLITDISTASKLDAALSRETFEPVNLSKLLRDLVDMYKNPLERGDVSSSGDHALHEAVKDGVLIRVTLPPGGDVWVVGSAGRLIQVFQNILSNALSFSTVKGKITIAAEVKGKRVTVYIDDEGPGIPESKLGAIFERFYSERPQHEDYGKHSGLGLSICKQIVMAHKGLIYADNVMDRGGVVKGARFAVILNTVKAPGKEE